MRASLARMGNYIEDVLDEDCGPPPLALAFAWTFFGSNEFAGAGMLTGPALTFNLIRIVVATYVITNWICPSQLSTAMVSNDQIECSGGALRTGERFTLNLRFNRNPPSGVGGQLWVRLADTGKLMGPYTITGP